MVSKAILKVYAFASIEKYFEYIIESRTNGQHRQARKLYAKLSAEQKNEFRNWFSGEYEYDARDADTTTAAGLNEFLNYING